MTNKKDFFTRENSNLETDLIKDSEKIKQLEIALEDLQNKFNEAESIANFGFWEVNPTTLNPVWTEGIFKIVGYDSKYGQVKYYDQKKFIHPEDWDHFYETLQYVINTKKDAEMDVRSIRQDGSIRVLHIIAKPKKDLDDNLIGIKGTAQDITGLKTLETKLKESEIFYRTLFENTGTASIILDDSSNIIMCNTQCEELTGYSKEELMGNQCLKNIVSKKYYDTLMKNNKLQKEGSKNPPESYEIELMDKKDSLKTVLINVSIIPGTKKSVVTLIDLTERKKIERELSDSERRYRYMVENASAGMFILDQNNVIKYLNEHMARLLGYTVYEMLEKNIKNFVDEEEDFTLNKESFENKIIQYSRFRFLDKKRNVFWTNLTVSPIYGSKNRYRGLLGIVTDTNMDKRIEEAFLVREEMFTDIIYEMMELLNNFANNVNKSELQKNDLSENDGADNN
jgi:PAS domain S-box-containing protein